MTLSQFSLNAMLPTPDGSVSRAIGLAPNLHLDEEELRHYPDPNPNPRAL